MAYRISRNIEASIIDYLKGQFQADWNNDRVEKTFAKIYSIELPSICIRVGTTEHETIEIGNNATLRTAQVLVDIFGSNDGNRLDIKDWLISKVKDGFIYYEYVIEDGKVKSKIENGRLRVLDIDDSPINFDLDKNNLDKHDRFRHIITLTISLGKIET